MKLRVVIPAGLLWAGLLSGCSADFPAMQDGEVAASDTVDQQSSSDLYVNDAVESAGSDETSISTSVDASVQEELRTERLKEMAAKLLKASDTDSSGSLALEEFLTFPDRVKRHDGTPAPSEEVQAKIKAKLTEEFEKYAGDDSLLSSDELIALLTAQAPRVCHYRKNKDGGRGAIKTAPSWDEILTKYDKDGDKVLSQAEFEAFMQDRQGDREKMRAGMTGGPGQGKGQRPGIRRGPPPPSQQ